MSAELTLFQAEDNLQALYDTVEFVAEDDNPDKAKQLAELELAIKDGLTRAVEKRDKVAQFIAHCESQVELAKKEEKRIEARKRRYNGVIERLKDYAKSVIVGLGPDAKGKWKKLEGQTATFALAKNPASANIHDEAAIPASFKAITLTLPAELWEELLGSFDIEQRDFFLGRIAAVDANPSVSIDRRAVLAALKANQDVAGAAIAEESFRVRID